MIERVNQNFINTVPSTKFKKTNGTSKELYKVSFKKTEQNSSDIFARLILVGIGVVLLSIVGISAHLGHVPFVNIKGWDNFKYHAYGEVGSLGTICTLLGLFGVKSNN